MVSGQTPDGKDATNELSYLCLEVANQLKTTQPVMAVRTWEGTPEELIRKGMQDDSGRTGKSRIFQRLCDHEDDS